MIYLDNSATTPAFPSVACVVADALTEDYYNVSSPYGYAMQTEKKLNTAADVLAKAMGCTAKELIFTSGGTESDNTALNCAPDHCEVIVSNVEHHAILNCQAMLEKRGCKMILCPVAEDGTVHADTLASLLTERTGLVSIMHVNNETGAVNDIAALAKTVKAYNPQILFHSDGVQAFMHVPTDMKTLGVDLYSVSAHKVHGPKGMGLLYVRTGVKFTPYLYGGGQQQNKRSGTVNVPGILGFAEAVRTLGSAAAHAAHLEAVKSAFIRELSAIPDARLTIKDSAPNILSIAFPGVKAASLQTAVEQQVLIAKGSACTSRSSKISHVLEAMHLPREIAEATVRLSFGAMNTPEEAPEAAKILADAITYLRKYKRK